MGCFRRSFGLFPLLLLPFESAAEPFALEQEFLSDIPVILTATRLPQKQAELPASVTVIDREMIEASGAVDIPDLLRLVAGFQIGRDNGDGVRTTVAYHGVTDNYARRMQVLVDGRSVYNPATGGIEWSDLLVQLEDIARIEVTRGPNGVTYGSNSFVGVINIITRHPDELPLAVVKHLAGERGHSRSFGRFTSRNGNLDQRLSVFRESSDGLRDLSTTDVREVNDSYAFQGFTWQGEYRAGINDYLTFGAGHGAGKKQRGTSIDPFDPTRDRDVTNSYIQFDWRHVASSNEEFKLNFYHQRYRLEDSFRTPLLSELYGIDPAAIPFLVDALIGIPGQPDQSIAIDIGLDTSRTNLELEHIFAPAGNWRVVWGGEARLDRIRAPDYLGTGSTVENHLYRLFVNNEIRPAERWIVNAGVMAERDYRTSTRLSPRLAVNRLIGDSHYLRVSQSTAYRTPTAVEGHANLAARFSDGQILDLIYLSPQPPEDEEIHATELAFGGSLVNPKLQYEVKLFRERITDIMVSVSDDDNPDPIDNKAFLFLSNGNATTRGAELQLRFHPDRATSLSLAYSWAKSTGQILDRINPTVYRDVGASTPRSTLGLLLSHRFTGGLLAGLGFYRVSDMHWLGPGDETGGFNTIDLTLRQPFRARDLAGNVSLILRDAGGEYFDYRNSVYREPRAYLGLEVQF